MTFWKEIMDLGKQQETEERGLEEWEGKSGQYVCKVGQALFEDALIG